MMEVNMFREKYFDLKNKRSDSIIIMKNGIFYNVLGKDCYIIKNIFGYKVSTFGDTIRVGFPIKGLNKVLDTLDKLKISYLVYEQFVVLESHYNSENYKLFLKNNLSINDRIKCINERLNEIKYDEKIFKALESVEKICMKN